MQEWGSLAQYAKYRKQQHNVRGNLKEFLKVEDRIQRTFFKGEEEDEE